MKTVNGFKCGLFVIALLCFVPRAWAQEAPRLVGKCDPKKMDTITVTETEYNPKATMATDYVAKDTLQGGHGGNETTNTEQFYLDDHGQINQFFENGKQANPKMAIASALVAGNEECVGIKAMMFAILKKSPSFAASAYPGSNLQGNWFQQKSVMGNSKGMWARYLEKDDNGKKGLIEETRAFGTLGFPKKPNEVHILYDELDLNDGVVTKEISIYYDNPSGLDLSLDNIDTKKTIEAWAADHSGSIYFDEKDFTYAFRG